MRIEIRGESVLLDGYVNAVGRDSRPIVTERGKCVERIEPGAFERALKRATDVALLLNHNPGKHLGSLADKNLELFEDVIGLRAICTVTDPEVVQKAREKKLQGWSFKMYVTDDEMEERAEGLPLRHVKELDIEEVSIIDDRMTPCYIATTIEQRAGEEKTLSQRGLEFRAVTTEDIDYSEYEKRIEAVKKTVKEQ